MTQMFEKDFNDSILMTGYHEKVIKKVEIDGNNIKLTILDEVSPPSEIIINKVEIEENNIKLIPLENVSTQTEVIEITFIDCNATYNYGLEGREIYRLENLAGFPSSSGINHWHMSFMMYMKNMTGHVYERVIFDAKNIISKVYENGVVVEEEDLNKKYGVLTLPQ